MGTLVQTSAPETEPVSLTEAKTHARAPLDVTAEDNWFLATITAARQKCEDLTGLAMITQEWKLLLDCWDDPDYSDAGPRLSAQAAVFPFERVINLWLARFPIQTVESVKYKAASDGALTTLSASQYTLGIDSGRLAAAYGQIWPVPRAEIEAIEIAFTAGYGDDAVPELAKQAILLTVAHWWEHRGDETTDDLPMAAKSLLRGLWTGAC